MVDAFAISGNGLAGTLVRPSALILAMAGGMIVPGAQVEAGMQPEAIQGPGIPGVGAKVALATRAYLADVHPEPDVLTLADVMGLRAIPAVDHSNSGLTYVPVPSRSLANRQLGEEVSSSLNMTAARAETLSFGRAVDGVVDRGTGTPQFADAFPVDVFAREPGDSDAGLVAPPAPPALSAGELSGDASMSVLELVAFDPFAAKSQPSAAIAENLSPSLAAHVDGIEFVSSPVVQPLPEQELTAKPAISANPTKAAPALHDQRTAASPKPLAAPSKAALPALASPPPIAKAKTVQAAPARSSLPAAMFTPRPLSTPKVVSGRTMPGYRLSGDVIEFGMATRINGQPAAPISLRVTKDDRLWLRTGDLLSLVKAMMPQDQYDRLAASSAMEDYVTFDKVRNAGISLRYDVARNLIAIGND